MGKNLNYTPWNEFRHVETRKADGDWDDYLLNLSKSVGEACDKFFDDRGMNRGQADIPSSWIKKNNFTLSGQVLTEKSPMK
jgi:hypothetical protein